MERASEIAVKFIINNSAKKVFPESLDSNWNQVFNRISLTITRTYSYFKTLALKVKLSGLKFGVCSESRIQCASATHSLSPLELCDYGNSIRPVKSPRARNNCNFA